MPINREEMHHAKVNGSFDESALSGPFSSWCEAYQALLWESYFRNLNIAIFIKATAYTFNDIVDCTYIVYIILYRLLKLHSKTI